jgi:hypothetical protein
MPDLFTNEGTVGSSSAQIASPLSRVRIICYVFSIHLEILRRARWILTSISPIALAGLPTLV